MATNAFALPGPPFVLECASISSAGDVLADGSILVVGQSVVGTASNANYTIEVGAVPCLRASRMVDGDFDGDGDVDLADVLRFQQCFSGAGAAFGPACQSADFDRDGDVDLADLVALQAAFTGSQ